MKVRSLLWARRFLFFILSLLLIFSLMTLTPDPVYAQGSYDEFITQIQAIKQQMEELLAIYNAADAATRAAMDASVAAGMRQSLQQIYGSLSDSDRVYMDEQFRQISGHSFTQLMQSMTTVPALVNGVDILFNALVNLSNGVETPSTTQPPATKQPTAKPSASSEINFEPPEQGGVVDLRGDSFNLKISLGWQLFGDPDMSEEEALSKYNQNIQARKSKLLEEKAAAEKRIEELEKARDSKNIKAYINNLKINLASAKSDRVEALDRFFQYLGSEAKDKAIGSLIEGLPDALADKSTQSYAVLTALAAGTNAVMDTYPALKTLQDKINKKEELTNADWDEVGEATVDLIGVLNDATFKSKWVSGACISAKLIGKLLDIRAAQVEVNNYEKALKQLSDAKQYSDTVFQHKIDVENMKIQEYDRQLERLKQGGYVDTKYLNPS